MSTKKSKPYRVVGAKDRLLAQLEAEVVAARKRRRDTGITFLIVMAVVIGIVSLFGWYQATNKPAAVPSDSASATDTANLAFAPVTVTDGKGLTIGVAGATNVVSLYSDFACTHCAEFETAYGQTLANLREVQRQTALREQAEYQTRVLMETSPLAILTLDRDARVVIANRSAHEMLGCEEESLPGTAIGLTAPQSADSHLPDESMSIFSDLP